MLSFQVTQLEQHFTRSVEKTDVAVRQMSPASQLSFPGSHFAYFQVKVLGLWLV